MSLTTSKFILETTKSGKKHDFEVDFNPPDTIAGQSVFMKLKNVAVETKETNTNTKPIPVLLSINNLPQTVSTLSKTNSTCQESRILGCFKTNANTVPNLTTTIKKFPPTGLPNTNNTITKLNGQFYGNENYQTYSTASVFDESLSVSPFLGEYDANTGFFTNPGPTTTFNTNTGVIYGQGVKIKYQNRRKLVHARNYSNPGWLSPPMEMYILGSNDDGVTNDVLGIGYGSDLCPGGWVIINCNTTQTYNVYQMVVTKARLTRTNIHLVELEMYFEDYVSKQYPPVGLLKGDWTITGQTYGNGEYSVTASNGTSGTFQLFNDQWFNDTYFTGPSATIWDLTTGAYTGTLTTLATNNVSYPGAWVQLRMPVSIMLTTVTLVRVFSFAAPSVFVILGSNDGNTWDVVFNQSTTATYNPFNYFSVSPTNTNFYSYFRVVVSNIANPHATCNLGEILFFGVEVPQLHTESNISIKGAPRLLTSIAPGHTTLNFSAEQLHQEQLEDALPPNTKITADIEFEISTHK